MNKTAIKNFAIWARVQLIEAAKQRAYEYAITKDGENKTDLDSIGGRVLSAEEKQQRKQLLEQIRRKGYEQVMEEAAYTWFNRFIALRFMEVNGYLPSKIRVFTDENNSFKPEILKEAMSVELDGLDREKVLTCIDTQNNEELYKYLIITQCNALNAGLPLMFEKISNWTELLFPSGQLKPDSVLAQMISAIPEEDWTNQVQIIGWLYQYYNTELKDDTFARLKKNEKVTKERIPAATQLFTPDWIVRYMVENSLGRLWYEGHNNFDKSHWKYYLDEAEQEPKVAEQLRKLRSEYANIKPEDIKLIDPCMGSGHILVYAFDVLLQIYTAAGWTERDAAKSIIENNLYGIDIDDRATQLAYFAVMMKARHYSRRILNGDVKPNVLSIQESNWMTEDYIAFVAGKNEVLKADLITLKKTFTDAKEYGSIISVPALHFDKLYERIDIIGRSDAEDLFQSEFQTKTAEMLLPLVKQAQIMAQKYDVVVTNPPYMGASNMNAKLSEFVKKYYPDSKSDLFACFMERADSFTKNNCFTSLITMESWMFLSSFEKLRSKVNTSKTIINMVHMPYLGKGGTSLGINFGTAAVIMKKGHIPNYAAQYEYTVYYECDAEGVPFTFPTINERWKTATQENFSKIPGSPVAYWLSKKVFELYADGETMGTCAYPKVGMQTSNNDKYLRLWFEVAYNEFGGNSFGLKWIKYLKGGAYRKWYGNLEYLLFYNKNAQFILQQKNARVLDLDFLSKKKCTWTDLTSGNNSFRLAPDDTFYDISGHCFFPANDDQLWLLAYSNSSIFSLLKSVFNSTFHCQVGDVAKIVVPILNGIQKQKITALANENVSLSRTDWDSYETSWDFKRHPLV